MAPTTDVMVTNKTTAMYVNNPNTIGGNWETVNQSVLGLGMLVVMDTVVNIHHKRCDRSDQIEQLKT